MPLKFESPSPVKRIASIVPNAIDDSVTMVRRRLRQRFRHAISGRWADTT